MQTLIDRPNRRVDAGSERHRHPLLPARRPERSVLRRALRPHQRHPADPCAARAGLRLHGAGLRDGEPASPRPMWSCPGPGFLNTTAALSTAYAVNAPVLALTGQIQQSMIGRNVGLLHELPDQLAIMRGLTKWADRISVARRRARPGQRSLPPPPVGTPAPGRARMRHGHLGAPRAGRVDRHRGDRRSLPGRRGRRRARRQAAGQRASGR